MISNEERILAIDYGIKRIGLALSDPLLIFAYPFKTIPNDSKASAYLGELIKEKSIKKIIMGYPFSDKESPTSVTKKILDLKKEIEKRYKMEVILWDETLTSVIARDMMLESISKKSKRKDKGILDRNSASVILQEYLNSIKK